MEFTRTLSEITMHSMIDLEFGKNGGTARGARK